MVDLVDINTNDPDRSKYSIKLLRGNTIIVTKEFLKSRNVPDIISIPISSEDYINVSNNLTQEKIENIMFPELLSTLQQGSKSWHDKLYHLHPKYMFILAKIGVLPSQFIYLNDYVPLCAS